MSRFGYSNIYSGNALAKPTLARMLHAEEAII